jgi:hypothetical protein
VMTRAVDEGRHHPQSVKDSLRQEPGAYRTSPVRVSGTRRTR